MVKAQDLCSLMYCKTDLYQAVTSITSHSHLFQGPKELFNFLFFYFFFYFYTHPSNGHFDKLYYTSAIGTLKMCMGFSCLLLAFFDTRKVETLTNITYINSKSVFQRLKDIDPDPVTFLPFVTSRTSAAFKLPSVKWR